MPAARDLIRAALRQPGRTAALFAALASLAVTSWYAPGQVRAVWGEIRSARSVDRLDRELVPAESVGLHGREIFVTARATIPEHATYYLATPPTGTPSSPPELRWVRVFATYWLLPRRRTDDPANAEWVISYLGDLNSLGLRYARVVMVAKGFALAEVRA